jgi:hypothetical protein
MALLKVPNLGKIKNLRQRNAQNSSKRIKRIDLRQNLMKIRSKTVNRWCMIGKGVTVYRYTDILQYEKINFEPWYDFWKTGIL